MIHNLFILDCCSGKEGDFGFETRNIGPAKDSR